jgi:hypothetical protein
MRKFITALLIATAAFTGCNASAQEAERSPLLPNTLGLHVGSRHSEPGFNDTNPGLYARWADANGTGWALGTYYNSQRAQSAWGGYSFSSPRLGSHNLGVSAALTLGVVPGYRAAKVLPLMVPSAALHFGDAAARLTYVPKVEKSSAAAVHLSLEYRF